LQDVVLFAEVHDGTEEAQSVLDEGDQHAQRSYGRHQAECDQCLPVETHGHAGRRNIPHHVAAAEPDHAGNRDGGEYLDDWIVNRVRHDRVFERVHVIAVDFRKTVVGLAFAIEELQHHHSADVLLQIRVDARDGNANSPIGIAHPVAKDLGRNYDERQHRKRDERQLPVHAQHDAQNSEEHEQVFEDGNDAGGEHLIQRIHVGGNAGHETSHGVLIEESNVEALQMAKDLAAQIEHHFLTGPLHEIGLQKLEHERHDQQSHVDGRDLRDASDRARTEPTPQT